MTEPATITGLCNTCKGKGRRGDGSRCAACKGEGTITVLQSQLFREPSKYGNEPVKANGLSFDSQAEYLHFLTLLEKEKAGEISQLQVHRSFRLFCPGQDGVAKQVTSYEADFTYQDTKTGELVVVDVKGAITDIYALKRRWMKLQYGIEIQEVKA